MHVAAFEGRDLSPFSALLSATQHLPLDYLPGVSREGCVALQLHTLQRKVNRGDVAAFAAMDDGLAVGLAVLEPLPWDSAILERTAGRVAALHVMPGARRRETTSALLGAVLDTSRKAGYACLDLQCHASDLASLHAACNRGFQVMATHLALVWDLSKPLPPCPGTPAVIVDARQDDVEALSDAAVRSVPPYSRFVVDDHFTREQITEVFRQWSANSVRGYADRVQLARLDGEVAGYCTWRIHTTAAEFVGVRMANLDLTAVCPEARRKHVLTAMIHDGLRWLREQDIEYAEVLTHALNTGMQRAGAYLGGNTLSARHSLHWHREDDSQD